MSAVELSAQYRYDPLRGSSFRAKNSFLGDLFPFGARSENTTVKYKLQYIQGKILPHSDKVKPLIGDYVRGGEFAVEFPHYGGETWYYYYNYPTTAWALLFLDLGNWDKLGGAAAFYPYINLPLVNVQRFSFNIKMGAGVAYITEKFDKNKPVGTGLQPVPEENNLAIGSNFNGFLSLGTNFELLLMKNRGISLTADAALNHFSNGSITKPNAGMNIFNLSAGIKYIPYIMPAPMRHKPSDRYKNWEPEVAFAAGMNEQNYTDPHKYLNMSLALGCYRPLTNRYRIGLNLDVFFNNAFYAARTLPEYYAGESSKIRAGFSLCNELMFGDLSLGFNAGVYMINRIEHDGITYFKLLAKYRVYDRIFVTVAVKTHLQVAECAEIGVGYTFVTREKTPFSWIPEKQKVEKPPLKYRMK
ncbi:hypothetical protein FACS189434_10720 [Bacteroidia bacterium]|nr:hypothetical protein FACS189434_10720 [Bacteroidia bacterium]